MNVHIDKEKVYTESAQKTVERARKELRALWSDFNFHDLPEEATIIKSALIAMQARDMLYQRRCGAAVTIDELRNMI